MIKWNLVVKRLIEVIDREKGTGAYFSGPRFIKKIQEFDPNCPDYVDYRAERDRSGKSSTRRDYYKDLLMELDEGTRVRVVNSILGEVEQFDPEHTSEIRKLLGGGTLGPTAIVPPEAWNGARLNDCLAEIDAAIAAVDYDRAVTLSYTCLEGFLGAFLRAKERRDSYPNELIALSKEVKDYLKRIIKEYPDEVLNGVTQAAHAVDKARNRFSESHFAGEAGSWLATYIRDLVNTQIRLLLHFM
jgi:hypothetical protein